jgi:hypothetical protein
MSGFSPQEHHPEELSLSRELQNCFSLLDKVGPLCQDIHSEQERAPVPSLMYHYTNDVGLRGILESGAFWLSNVFRLNDPSELKHGLTVALFELENIITNDPVEQAFASNFSRLLTTGLEGFASFFVCSFSRSGDDLGQWRAYADDGRGFTLAFDCAATEKAIKETYVHPNCLFAPFPVKYEEEALRKVYQKVMDVVINTIRGALPLLTDSESLDTFFWGIFFRLLPHLIGTALYFKHPAYSMEAEYRLLVSSAVGTRPPGEKVRFTPYRAISFLELDWASIGEHVLRGIGTGPAADTEVAVKFARDCLHLYRPSRIDIPVAASNIPYRGR